MKQNLAKKITSLLILSLTIQPIAYAIPGIPEARIACPGNFYANVLFNSDFSIHGPRLNKFLGKAYISGSGNKIFNVSGHQVVNRVNGDPVFWIFNIHGPSLLAEVSLSQQHDNLHSTAWGEVIVNGKQSPEIICEVKMQLNGANAPKPPSNHPYPR